MHHRLVRWHSRFFTWRAICTEEYLAIFLALVIFMAPASAAMRMQDRKLYMNSTEPGAMTYYEVAFRYMSAASVGSVDMLFCMDPIPHHACVPPPGLDVSNATLTDQSGETGYSISSRSTNHLVLSRTPAMVTPSATPSSYKLDNIRNPSSVDEAFSVRLRTHGSTDATGPQIDFGSVRGQLQDGITLETQVPPMLVFCLAEEVADNCGGTNENYYTDMGELDPGKTLTAQSQMAVGTNASGGFTITADGYLMSAGANIIDSPTVPTESRPGTNQFGINLVANDSPIVGKDPEGTWANAVTSPDYGVSNKYKYVPGDVVAYSPNVSLMKKFTVSYIVNSSVDLRPGVYTTTVTYIATGQF